MNDAALSWPDGATWVFQGTVAEDATGGTHVCTLTIVPGAGNEMEVLYGEIVVGATATAQDTAVVINDGTNELYRIERLAGGTTSSAAFSFPNANAQAATGGPGASTRLIVSGTMNLVLKVSTAAISVTQTFAVVCRIKGGIPTATLADTVGTPTLTTNTSKVF